jgi:RNA polymerase sigma factor (sigma-70 family)
MDQVLLPFLQTIAEAEKERRLEELLLLHAAPEIRFTLRQRLGFHVNQRGVNPQNQDAEDLYQEILTKTVQVLQDLHSSSPRAEIESFKQYVGRIATNFCINFLRAKSPARWRLKNNLRDVLNRQREFALWKVGRENLGGLVAWQGMNKTVSWPPQTRALEEELETFRSERFHRENIKQLQLKRIVIELFHWIGGPLELDSLVGAIAILLDVKDVPVESLDDKTNAWIEARVADGTVAGNSRLEEQALLRRLWETLRTLPAKQRDAYCFRFENDSGQDLFSLLLDTEIATLTQLAHEFGRPIRQILRLRSAMPMDSATAARELNASSTQVNKWRFYAVQRLEKELRPFTSQN